MYGSCVQRPGVQRCCTVLRFGVDGSSTATFYVELLQNNLWCGVVFYRAAAAARDLRRGPININKPRAPDPHQRPTTSMHIHHLVQSLVNLLPQLLLKLLLKLGPKKGNQLRAPAPHSCRGPTSAQCTKLGHPERTQYIAIIPPSCMQIQIQRQSTNTNTNTKHKYKYIAIIFTSLRTCSLSSPLRTAYTILGQKIFTN